MHILVSSKTTQCSLIFTAASTHNQTLFSIIGLKLLDGGGRTDLEEAEALSHAVDIIDVYSNSWGPPDTGAHVSGPGTLTQLVLKMGATIVSKV